MLDLDRRELAVVAPLVALIIVLGVYPQPLLNLIEPAVAATMRMGRPRRDRLMIEAPNLSLAALAPLLFVFGAACIGVLVEAFGPRDSRHPVQVAVALVGTARRPGLHPAAGRPAARSPPPGRSPSTAPALFLQATIAGLGALAILLFAERALDPARSAFVTSAAVPAGSPATASCSPPSGCRPRSTRWRRSPSAA